MAWRLLLALLGCAAIGAAAEEFNIRIAVVHPFPREVARGRTLEISGELVGVWRRPELVLIAPNGKTYLCKREEIADFRFRYTVNFGEGVGPYRMELIARKDTSIRSAARFTVWYGTKKGKEEEEPPIQGEKDPVTLHPVLLASRFYRKLNAFRASIRVDPVGWNEAVAARAREHALRMARAGRRQHRFGSVGGVRDLLRVDGSGSEELSGPGKRWDNLTGRRPFDRPAPLPPGPRVENHVVVFVLASESLDEMFEKYFVREAAFRLCAADPFCLEVAVGAARPPPREVKTKSALVYYCVCFVQVNDKTTIREQEETYAAVRRRAARKDPLALRYLGVWGRGGRATKMLWKAWPARDPDVSSAAFDGLLLLDEENARKKLAERTAKQRALLDRRRYAQALALGEPLRAVAYDGAITEALRRMRREADEESRREFRLAVKLPGDERRKALADLARRAAGLPVVRMIEDEKKKG